MKSLAEILAMFPTATLLALHPSSLATGGASPTDAAAVTEAGIGTPSAATPSVATPSVDVTSPTPSTTKTWEIVFGTPSLFVIDVSTDKTFCSYFKFADGTDSPPPYKIRRSTEDTSGQIDDDAGGSSVAHGDTTRPELGGFSPERSTESIARIFIYQIDLLDEPETTPQGFEFYVELR